MFDLGLALKRVEEEVKKEKERKSLQSECLLCKSGVDLLAESLRETHLD